MPVICPAPDTLTTPGGSKARTRLPAELLGKSSSRLFWLAMVVLVTSVILFAARHLLDPNVRAVEKRPFFLLVIGLLMLSSLGVILTQRSGLLSAARLLELGLLYEILVSFGLATMEFTRSLIPGHWSIGTSSVAMWVLTFGI